MQEEDKPAEKLAILKNDGNWSEKEYILVKKEPEFSILKDSKGSSIKIYNDRISADPKASVIIQNKPQLVEQPQLKMHSPKVAPSTPPKAAKPTPAKPKPTPAKPAKTKMSKPTKPNKAKTKEQPVSTTKAKKAKKDEKEFDISSIYNGVSEKEIYEKKNTFNESTECRTFVILNLKSNKRYIINTYNGIAKGGVEYPLKDKEKYVKKLLADGYKKH